MRKPSFKLLGGLGAGAVGVGALLIAWRGLLPNFSAGTRPAMLTNLWEHTWERKLDYSSSSFYEAMAFEKSSGFDAKGKPLAPYFYCGVEPQVVDKVIGAIYSEQRVNLVYRQWLIPPLGQRRTVVTDVSSLETR